MKSLFVQPNIHRLTTGGSRRLAQKIVTIVVIVAMLKFVGIPPVAIVCLVGAGFLVFIAVRRSQRRKTEIIFGFYVCTDEVLRDGEHRRYRFEIADVIKAGEKVVSIMPDPPPLSRFALGALYNSIGDHNAAVEQLGFAAEEEVLKESCHVSPSRQLRRYVERLRQIERRPERWPKLNSAIASLERMHQERAAQLLAESQQQLKRMVEAYESEISEQLGSPRKDITFSPARPLRSITPPPPISEVLNDIYQEDQTAS